MSNYDSPAYMDKTPAGVVNESTGLSGSDPGPYPPTDSIPDSLSSGTSMTSAVVTPASSSLVNADRVDVGPLDTLAGTQAKVYGASPDPLTGLGAELGQTGIGGAHTHYGSGAA